MITTGKMSNIYTYVTSVHVMAWHQTDDKLITEPMEI